MKDFTGNMQVAAVVLVSVLGISSALTCYECSGSSSSGTHPCKTPTVATSTSQCSTKCYYTYSKADVLSVKSESWARGCMGALASAACTQINTDLLGLVNKHSCCNDKDLCNGAPTAKVTTGVFVLAGLAAYLLGY